MSAGMQGAMPCLAGIRRLHHHHGSDCLQPCRPHLVLPHNAKSLPCRRDVGIANRCRAYALDQKADISLHVKGWHPYWLTLSTKNGTRTACATCRPSMLSLWSACANAACIVLVSCCSAILHKAPSFWCHLI